MLAIDHVLLPTLDLDLAAAEVETRFGLASVEGGRHPSWGTANRIVPLGDSYVELITVVDHGVAVGAPFGRWVATAVPGRPLGWAVRTDDIEVVGRRLDLAVVPGSRDAPGGVRVTWRSAGLEAATGAPGLPFFIEWGDGVPFPGATPVRHPGGPAHLERVTIAEDPWRLEGWLGEHDLAVTVTPGDSGVSAVTVARGGQDIELRLGGGDEESRRPHR